MFIYVYIYYIWRCQRVLPILTISAAAARRAGLQIHVFHIIWYMQTCVTSWGPATVDLILLGAPPGSQMACDSWNGGSKPLEYLKLNTKTTCRCSSPYGILIGFDTSPNFISPLKDHGDVANKNGELSQQEHMQWKVHPTPQGNTGNPILEVSLVHCMGSLLKNWELLKTVHDFPKVSKTNVSQHKNPSTLCGIWTNNCWCHRLCSDVPTFVQYREAPDHCLGTWNHRL